MMKSTNNLTGIQYFIFTYERLHSFIHYFFKNSIKVRQ